MPEDRRASLENQKVREFIAQVGARAEQLVKEGVDGKALAGHLAAVEKALDEKAHATVVAQRMTDLKGQFEQVAGGRTARIIVNLLNEVLGTGVPPV